MILQRPHPHYFGKQGNIISYSTFEKQKDKKQETDLENKINATKPSEETQNELRKYKLQLNKIMNRKTQCLMHRLRYENFKYSYKSGKFVANQIKCNKEKTTMAFIKDQGGKPRQSPAEISNIFQSFYADLCSIECDPNQDINFFNIYLAHLTEEQANTLNLLTTLDEL